MLKLKDLATRADFQLGPLSVSPSRRRVKGPAGEVQLEPLIMQVFLLLLDGGGRVVTRDELFDQCWGGVIVGDDSLNRAIARVRRIEAQTAPGLFEIETTPRTGYRVTGRILELLDRRSRHSEVSSQSRHPMSRRALIGGGSAAALAVTAGAVGWWSVRRSQADRRLETLMSSAHEALRYGSPDSGGKAVEYLQAAVAMNPDAAEAFGLLAYAQWMVSDYGDPREAGAAVEAARRAARVALAIDPTEPNARVALVMTQRSLLDLAGTELRLREILAAAPTNQLAMKRLWDLLQSSGRSRAAWAMNERAIALDPLSASNNYPRAQLLWILGRDGEADRVIDLAMRFWPSHSWVRFARFTIYAFTQRPLAALAMLDDPNLRPQRFTSLSVAMWRVSLKALDQPSRNNVTAALTTNLETVRQTPALASQAVLVLSALGELDAAFDIANELLVFRRATGRGAGAGSTQPSIKSTGWRFTPWLFTPPARPMWSDPRFDSLCQGIGLTDYWRARKVKPDYVTYG